MQKNYTRTSYGEIMVNGDYQIVADARELINHAAKMGKISKSYDTVSFDRKGRSDGDAVHHEIYDIHPDPLRVLVCVRTTEGTRYGVKTTSKTYYIIKKHGRGVKITEANKHISAKSAKNAGCELGCAITSVERGKIYLREKPIKPIEIVYKKLAVGDDGRLYSVYDGSLWIMGAERTDRALKNHNGGLYAYRTAAEAQNAMFPGGSKLEGADHVICKCEASGNYVDYDNGKIAFTHLKPINIAEI